MIEEFDKVKKLFLRNEKHGESHCVDAQRYDEVKEYNEVYEDTVVVAVRTMMMNSTTQIEFEEELDNTEVFEE